MKITDIHITPIAITDPPLLARPRWCEGRLVVHGRWENRYERGARFDRVGQSVDRAPQSARADAESGI